MNKSTKFLLTLVVLNSMFFLLPAGAVTKSRTFDAIADAWIHQGFPSTNYGTDPELNIGWEDGDWKQALIRFNLTSQPTRYNKVQLVFNCTRVSEDFLDFIIVDELFFSFKWNESTLTWDNGPNVLDGIHLAYIENPKVGINKINLPDLTYTSTSLHLYDNFSIWLHPDSANSDITIASRESSLTPPRIVCFFELSDLPIILASIVIVAVLSIGGYLSYYLLKNRRKTNKD